MPSTALDDAVEYDDDDDDDMVEVGGCNKAKRLKRVHITGLFGFSCLSSSTQFGPKRHLRKYIEIEGG